MIRRFALVLLFLLVAFVAAGGDIAMFENLGFSTDSGVFVFGQYGVDADTSQPYAEVYAVDVASNSFVPGGVFSSESPAGAGSERPLSLGQDGRGALYNLISEADPVFDRYGVDHLRNGRPIYILVDGEEPKERISFRDFNTDIRYEFVLRQEARDSADTVSAAFHIELTITDENDRTRRVTVGRPGYFRPGIVAYRITQVLLSPDEDSVVVVVEKETENGSVRYMVETTAVN